MTTRRLPSLFGNRVSGGCGIAFFAVFLLMGLLFLGIFAWMLWQDVQVYTQYLEGSCKITGKEILNDFDSDGDSYAPHFEFTVFTQNGESYPAEGYQKHAFYYGNHRTAEKRLDQFKVEQSYPCWYDPADPRQAVLKRGTSLGLFYLFALIPLAFVAIGLSGIISGLFSLGKSPEAALKTTSVDVAAQKWLPDLKTRVGRYQAVRLPVEQSHAHNMLMLAFFALFWNGIVSVFVVAGLNGAFPPLIWLFLIPFILVGLFLIFQLFRQVLIWLTAGEVIVELGQEPLQAGQKTDLTVVHNEKKMVQELIVRLICREQVTYSVGTDTHTETHTLHDELLLERFNFRIDHSGMREDLSVNIPATAMHTFKAAHNEIIWQVEVSLKVAGAPDFEQSFPLRVLPTGSTL